MEGTMPLMLTEVRVWNDDPEAYRLIIKDGTEIVGQTTIDPGLTGDIYFAPRVPITGPLTLIAEKV